MRGMRAPLEIAVRDPCLVVLVGAAGAGKSTFAGRHFAPDEVLSSDAFRELVSGDPADQRATRPAFAALHRALAIRLDGGRLTVVDATNVTPAARAALLRVAATAGVPAMAIVLDPPSDLVLTRNAGRPDRVVPADTVEHHLRQLAVAAAGGRLEREGFDPVVRLTEPASVDAVRIVRVHGGR